MRMTSGTFLSSHTPAPLMNSHKSTLTQHSPDFHFPFINMLTLSLRYVNISSGPKLDLWSTTSTGKYDSIKNYDRIKIILSDTFRFRYVKTAGKMKEKMLENDIYKLNEVSLEKYYNDENADEESDTYRLLKEQLNRMKQTVRGTRI